MNEPTSHIRPSTYVTAFTFLIVFSFYMGWGIDNLGLRATSPIIRFVRQGLFPWFSYIFPLLLIVSSGLAIGRVRRDKASGFSLRTSVLTVVINALSIVHWFFLLLFARVLGSFL